jgi:hypothetical protein
LKKKKNRGTYLLRLCHTANLLSAFEIRLAQRQFIVNGTERAVWRVTDQSHATQQPLQHHKLKFLCTTPQQF